MENNFDVEFGAKVRERRIALGYTQQELADMCGFKTRSSICFVESGKRSVPLDVAKKIAIALNVDVEWLFGMEETMFNYELNEYEKELIDLVRELPAGAMTKVINIVKALK